MKITKLTKRIGRVINIGNYQTLKIEAEVTAEGSFDSYDEVDKELYDRCTQSLNADLKRFKEARKKDEKDKT